MLLPRARLLAAVTLFASGAARAEPAACAGEVRVSPCFDADPLWLPTTPSRFAGLPSPRSLSAGALSTSFGASYSHRPVVLVAPSPDPDGREIPVVENTSTLTLGARYGLGHGLDAGLVVPIVPYQNGTGTEGVTAQHGSDLTPTTLRDPRLEFSATLLGRAPDAPLALGTRLVLALPIGASSALAGYASPTLAPGAGAELRLARFTLGADFSLRFREAVNFGSVREGSEAVFAVGAAFELLRAPELGVGVEASLRPRLASPPPGAAEETLDLPAEWLGSVRFSPAPGGAFSLFAGAGSGLPLSYAAEPGTARETTLGVTAPAFRAVLAARHVFP
ncbi:MAG TPA: hypothetical protein VGK73_00325 [Polyangiaceae bacterium]